MILKKIATMENDFSDKFGIPRQSGLVPELTGRIVFEPEYREAEAFRGLEGYSHLWLLWHFSEASQERWSPTVRPPRLGGNTRVGVFATRSPYRPNPVGLSCVELKKIVYEGAEAPYLVVAGADLMSGTPIFDVKPYLPYVDAHPEARGGFSDAVKSYHLDVVMSEELGELLPEEKREALRGVLAGDPRPAYQKDPERVYGMNFGAWEVHFTVDDPVLTVVGINERKS